MTKFDPTYRIQVKPKDKVSGKLNVYSTTWKPQIGMTPKQMEREANRLFISEDGKVMYPGTI